MTERPETNRPETNRPETPGADLDALLARAREAAPPPLPAGLQARLLADALSVQALSVQAPSVQAPSVQALSVQAGRHPRAASRAGRLRLWLAELGGLPGLAGMSAAGLAGLWIGLAEPLPGLPVSALLGDGAAALIVGAAPGDSPFDAFDPLD